jgi:hypothetical protein
MFARNVGALYQTTRRHNIEDYNINFHRRENLHLFMDLVFTALRNNRYRSAWLWGPDPLLLSVGPTSRTRNSPELSRITPRTAWFR